MAGEINLKAALDPQNKSWYFNLSGKRKRPRCDQEKEKKPQCKHRDNKYNSYLTHRQIFLGLL